MTSKALDINTEVHKIISQSFEENFDVFEYFSLYNEIYFDGSLGCLQLFWSKRMTSCAGVFSLQNNIPIIRLSEPLLKYRQIHEIKETLLHEMIHAYCYIRQFDMSDDLSGHGKYFKQKMYELNKETKLNITVYHSFHDEVDYYAKHIWKCNGICQNKPPYFGYVRRQMNRPPQKADKWWKEHQKSCGGTFIKISDDNNKGALHKKVKKKLKQNDKHKENIKGLNNIHTFHESEDNNVTRPKKNKNKKI